MKACVVVTQYLFIDMMNLMLIDKWVLKEKTINTADPIPLLCFS